MHASTYQTPFFANHGLHPKFDIQGVHKIMNLITKDWAMWLVDVQAQLVSNLEKTQNDTRRMLKNIVNLTSRLGTRFGFNDNISKQQGH